MGKAAGKVPPKAAQKQEAVETVGILARAMQMGFAAHRGKAQRRTLPRGC